jgi:hypothetical protein
MRQGSTRLLPRQPPGPDFLDCTNAYTGVFGEVLGCVDTARLIVLAVPAPSIWVWCCPTANGPSGATKNIAVQSNWQCIQINAGSIISAMRRLTRAEPMMVLYSAIVMAILGFECGSIVHVADRDVGGLTAS